jgi:hypothetical protein
MSLVVGRQFQTQSLYQSQWTYCSYDLLNRFAFVISWKLSTELFLFCPKYSRSLEISDNFNQENGLHAVAFWGDDGEIFQLSVVCQGQRHSRGQIHLFPYSEPVTYVTHYVLFYQQHTYNDIVPYVTGPMEHSVYMCILIHFVPGIHQCSFSGTSCTYVHISSLLTKYSSV